MHLQGEQHVGGCDVLAEGAEVAPRDTVDQQAVVATALLEVGMQAGKAPRLDGLHLEAHALRIRGQGEGRSVIEVQVVRRVDPVQSQAITQALPQGGEFQIIQARHDEERRADVEGVAVALDTGAPAAGPAMLLQDRDPQAGGCQVGRRAQTGDAGTDDDHVSALHGSLERVRT